MNWSADEPVYVMRHEAWTRLPTTVATAEAELRRLRGGASDTWYLALAPGARLTSRGVTAEGTVTVTEGRLCCTIFGNEVDLPRGHFALIPPNTPFLLRVGGRSPARALVFFSRRLPEAPGFDLT